MQMSKKVDAHILQGCIFLVWCKTCILLPSCVQDYTCYVTWQKEELFWHLLGRMKEGYTFSVLVR